MATKIPLIVILGPTASGKTATVIELAQKINGEIICADSRTIYKGMDIATAKPTQEDRKKVTHHLLDVVNIDDQFTVADFKRLANEQIISIASRNKVPLLVGGSGLYIDSVIFDYQFGGKSSTLARSKLEQMSTEDLVEYATTSEFNLKGINIQNKRHLIRAIERGGVVEQKKELRNHTLVLGIKISKEKLQQKIETRVDEMFKQGFLSEVEQLYKCYGWDHEAMSGIGYKVARQYFEGMASIEQVREALIKRDRSLAKRQMTWFKRNPYIEWFEDTVKMLEAAENFVKYKV